MNACFKIQSSAAQNFLRRLVGTLVLYAVTLGVTLRVLKTLHPGHIVVVLMAFIPAIPIIGIIAFVALYLKEETDEFQRAVLTETLLWALACTLTITSVWGFLEMYAGVPPLQAFWVFVLYSIFVGVVAVPVHMRYRSDPND